MHQFTVNHHDFNGFSEYFDDHILTHLEIAETARIAAVSKAKTRWIITAVIVIALVIGLVSQTGNLFLGLFPMVLGGAIGGAWASSALSSLKSETKTHLVHNISQFLGWTFTEKVMQPPNIIEALYENKLLTGRYDRSSFEDRIQGSAHGADFEMVEAHLERKKTDDKGRTSWVTVFRGQLIGMDFHREFSGRTVVLRDKKIFNSKKKAGMKRVGLVDPVFEKIFEAYGTDQVEARYLLTPTFMQRLVDLEACVDGKNIRFGFIGGLLLIVVETHNKFEAGSMYKPLVSPERTQKILDEFSALLDVIDGVLKPEDRRESVRSHKA